MRFAVHTALRGAGFAVDSVGDLPDADVELAVNSYDCAVFDRRLPGGDSLSYVRDRRAAGWAVPVLFLTGLSTVPHLVEGLAYGDDYVTKPFEMAVLEARVRRLCLQVVPGPPPVLRCGDLELDPGRREVRRAGTLLTLTKTQFAVLELLMTKQPEPVSTRVLMEQCWDELEPDPNRVQVLIGQLRRKLHDPPIIETVLRRGYRLIPPRP
ncbi:response regulator transcription factor [Fodinicola feengrottensis]|uniref:Response regulator transcription factor n=1 Tax=Fodinicola feengrottensis TaxID=435914 RepID=A0ABP4UHP0_9ACTN